MADWASRVSLIMVITNSGLVANATSSPIPASLQRGRASVYALGGYNSRSKKVRPVEVA